MRRFILFLILAPLGFLTGCSPESSSRLKDSKVNELNGDAPDRGRSLFDALTIAKNAAGGYEQKVEFPFTKLRAQIEAQSLSPNLVTLLPKGRSLQRNATDQPFRFPRVVMAVTGEAKQTGDSLGLLLKDRLYIGYVEAANQLEVISFNEAAGRFEFQLVEGYGAGQKSSVRYANRSFCLSCHQNGSPIFSNAPWDESIANTKISDKVIAARGEATYLGIPLKQFRNVPNEIQNSAQRANLLGPYQRLWAKGCDTGSENETKRCRRLTLELAIQYALTGDYDINLYSEASILYAKAWRKEFPQGLDLISPDIPNFDPLTSAGGSKDPLFLAGLGLDVASELQKLAADSDIPAAVDPLKDRTKPAWQEWRLESSDPARLIFGVVENLTEADIKLLRSALPDNEAIKRSIDLYASEAQSVLKETSIDRCRWLPNLLRLSGSSSQPKCPPQAQSDWPPAQATGQHGTTQNPDLQLFIHYCGACHQSGPKNFLAGTSDAELARNLGVKAAEHIQRLNWANPQPGRSPMPPAGSAQRAELEKAPADQQRMKQYLNSL